MIKLYEWMPIRITILVVVAIGGLIASALAFNTASAQEGTPPPARISGWQFNTSASWWQLKPNWWIEGANQYVEDPESVTLSQAKRALGLSNDATIWGWNAAEQRYQRVTQANFKEENLFQAISYQNGFLLASNIYDEEINFGGSSSYIYQGWNMLSSPRNFDLAGAPFFDLNIWGLYLGTDGGQYEGPTGPDLPLGDTYNCGQLSGTLVVVHQSRSTGNQYVALPCHPEAMASLTSSGASYLPLGNQQVNIGDSIYLYWRGQYGPNDLSLTPRETWQNANAVARTSFINDCDGGPGNYLMSISSYYEFEGALGSC